MDPATLIHDFNYTIDSWLKALDKYGFEDLIKKSSSNGWSLGQVYVHIILETNFFLQQAMICLSTDNHSMEEMSEEAKSMFKKNEFPNIALEGPPTNNNVQQPGSINVLRKQLLGLKTEANRLTFLLQANPSSGKTRHPGLNYFNAGEWLQFAEMHLRHHFRQKERIDEFLKTQ